MAQNEFWQGNKAIAMGAIAAGCRFFGGYPITPSTEVMEVMSEELPKLGGKFVQMEDEIGGIAATLGASIAGLKAMTASSGPGISLKQELLGYGYIAEIPMVLADIQRGGPSTGLPTKVSQADVMQATTQRSPTPPAQFRSATRSRSRPSTWPNASVSRYSSWLMRSLDTCARRSSSLSPGAMRS